MEIQELYVTIDFLDILILFIPENGHYKEQNLEQNAETCDGDSIEGDSQRESLIKKFRRFKSSCLWFFKRIWSFVNTQATFVDETVELPNFFSLSLKIEINVLSNQTSADLPF